MKKVYEFYMYKTIQNSFIQIALLPGFYITHSKQSHFIESGIYTDIFIIGFNFLIWDFGIQIFKDIY